MQERTGYPTARQRLFYNNMEMDNRKDLEFYDILQSLHGKLTTHSLIFAIVIVLRLKPDVETSLSNYIDVYGALKCPEKLKHTLDQVRQGFNRKLIP